MHQNNLRSGGKRTELTKKRKELHRTKAKCTTRNTRVWKAALNLPQPFLKHLTMVTVFYVESGPAFLLPVFCTPLHT